MKPTWVSDCGKVTLYLGDCRDVLPTLGKVDCVVTDPPYGVSWDTNYTRFTTGFNIPRKSHRPVQNDEVAFDPSQWLRFRTVVLFGANCFSGKLPIGSWLIWDKRFQNGSAFLADGEAAWWNSGHGVYIKSVTQQGCIRNEEIFHPTQKPIAIMTWIIDKTTKDCDVILDPYLGSGTTGVSAVRLGRSFIGIEIDEQYFSIAKKRIQEELRKQSFLEPKTAVNSQKSLFETFGNTP